MINLYFYILKYFKSRFILKKIFLIILFFSSAVTYGSDYREIDDYADKVVSPTHKEVENTNYFSSLSDKIIQEIASYLSLGENLRLKYVDKHFNQIINGNSVIFNVSPPQFLPNLQTYESFILNVLRSFPKTHGLKLNLDYLCDDFLRALPSILGENSVKLLFPDKAPYLTWSLEKKREISNERMALLTKAFPNLTSLCLYGPNDTQLTSGKDFLKSIIKLKNLKYFQLNGFRSYIIKEFDEIDQLSNLETLDFSWCNWGCGPRLYLPLSKLARLKVWHDSSCVKINVHDLTTLPHLKKIILHNYYRNEDCENFTCFSSLKNLEELSLSGVRNFPIKIAEAILLSLPNLKLLGISFNCAELHNFNFFSNLINLHTLTLILDSNDKYTGPIPLMPYLPQLRILIVKGVRNLNNYEFLSNLTNLENLYLENSSSDRNPIVHDVESLTSLRSLKSLNFFGSVHLSNPAFISSLTNLETLDMYSISGMTDEGLTALSHLCKLRVLRAPSGQNATNLSYLLNLTSLEKLDLKIFPNIEDEDMQNLSRLYKIKTLAISHFDKITNLNFLTGLTNLEDLTLSDLPKISLLGKDGLPRLPKLKSLKIGYLGDLGALHKALFSSVSRWAFKGLEKTTLEELQKLCSSSYAKLERFFVERPFMDFQFLSSCNNLEELSLEGFIVMTQQDMEDIAKYLPKLKIFELKDCWGLNDAGLSIASKLLNLRTLTVNGSPNVTIEGFRALASLKNLRNLNYFCNKQVHSFGEMGESFFELKSLQKLNLED